MCVQVTTLRAAIHYIYGLQSLLEEVQTGTLDLAAYQLSEAELKPTKQQPAKQPTARNITVKPNAGSATVRKATARRKPTNRPPTALGISGGGVGAGLKCSPVTLAMKGAVGSSSSSLANKKSDKKQMTLPTAAPKEAARYVLPLQPRDASHVLLRDYATAIERRPLGPEQGASPPTSQQGVPAAQRRLPTSGVMTSPPPPNLLSLRPIPVSALFPGGGGRAVPQPTLPPLHTLRREAGGAAEAAAEGRPTDLMVVEEGEGRGGISSAAFYCTTAGTAKTDYIIII